ncbi:MAG: Uma2 family endonuclease [Fimbriimonas sp.]|nr:Uma2 family endonuclease [Fimbriimonas sp.]
MTLTPSELAQYEEAAENGVRLEMIAGQPFWEFQPNYEHQRRLLRITKSIRPDPDADTGCGCFEAMDVGIRFSDDSLRRPDLSIFCREPELRELITLIPEAVVEVVSQGSRQKDLIISPPPFISRWG